MEWLFALLTVALGGCVVLLGWRFKSPVAIVMGVFLIVSTGVFYALFMLDMENLEGTIAVTAFVAGFIFLLWGALEGKQRDTTLPIAIGFLAFIVGAVYWSFILLGSYFPLVVTILGVLVVVYIMAYDYTHPGKLAHMASTKEIGDFALVAKTPRFGFPNVGGLKSAKGKLNDLVLGPLKKPELATKYGKQLSGGVLLYGPPGCGKTLLAEALAKEGGMAFYEVHLSDILSKWMGSSEKRLAKVFEQAKRKAPSLVFLDEIDSLGMQRGLKLAEDPSRLILSQLLMELDNVREDLRVFVVAATNTPWDVDAALLRPGRFDEHVFVPPPVRTARADIFRVHTKKLQENKMLDSDVDMKELASRTEGFSGADIADICRDATNRAWREAFGGTENVPVKMRDFEETIGRQSSSVTRWIQIAERYIGAAPMSEFSIEIKGMVQQLKDKRIAGYG